MKKVCALIPALLGAPAIAGHHEDVAINTGSELRDWCKDESEAALIGRGLSPFNWTASYWDQANLLMVKGQWRLVDSNMTVECSVTRGAEARFATLSIRDAD